MSQNNVNISELTSDEKKKKLDKIKEIHESGRHIGIINYNDPVIQFKQMIDIPRNIRDNVDYNFMLDMKKIPDYMKCKMILEKENLD